MSKIENTNSYVATITLIEGEVKRGMILLERLEKDLNILKIAMSTGVTVGEAQPDRWALLERSYK